MQAVSYFLPAQAIRHHFLWYGLLMHNAKRDLMAYLNSGDSDQLAHLYSLTSTFSILQYLFLKSVTVS